MGEWFEEWFGEEYLELYPHRDETDAGRLIGLVGRTACLAPGARVLDICCGAGRHARAFADQGHWTVGIDLSRHLLQRAQVVARVPLVRADVRRLPFRARSFDLAANLFTSFGYFETDDEHCAALAEMLLPVKSGGWFVLDFLNADLVRAGLVAKELMTTAAGPVTVERWLHDEGRFVVKTITTPDGRQFMERVRLLRRDDLVGMLTAAGGTVVHQFGSYDGAPADADQPRVILFVRAR